MANRLAFGWVLHQHQPVGNFPWVFDQVYHACYEPLLAAFERHPTVRVAMHYTGPLLDWLMAEHPDYLTRLAALAQRNQVEMLTGGYYEPIMPILPETDQVGQITKLSNFIRSQFGVEPAGMWLAERVWEPQLPSPLARAGVRYTVLDDTHFLMAGLTPDRLLGHYITEDLGHPLVVFPNPKTMRELIPWKPVRVVERELRKIAQAAGDQQQIVVMADDGEKFGSWPGTFDPLWRQGAFDRFLTMLESNADWLETVPLGDYMRRHPPLGRVYLPAASYAEMMEWALPAQRAATFETVRLKAERAKQDDVVSFLRGGTWRNFAAKYPEANNFHKKMLRVHNHIHEAVALLGPARTQEAVDQLWQGQCNCGYWHGVFGGLYLADIRSAIYQHLIRAETIADGAAVAREPTITLTDFDCDGREELLVEGPLMDVYLSPHDGGSIFEWDFKASPFNVQDTLARREEAYHRKLSTSRVEVKPQEDPLAPPEHPIDPDAEYESQSIHDIVRAKEAGLEKLLTYDPLRRNSLRERFLAPTTTLSQIIHGSYTDLGDFAGGAYTHQMEGLGIGAISVSLFRDGSVGDATGQRASLRLRKVLTIPTDDAEIRVTYTLHNNSARALNTIFAVEGNWGMLGGGGNPAAWYTIDGERTDALDARGEAAAVREFALTNAGVGVRLTVTPGIPATLWRYPVETVSNSESGFERIYQCSCALLLWPVSLPAGDRWSVTVRLALSQPD